MTLEGLERGVRARIVAVDWDRLAPEDGARLRALGLDAGARVAIAHRRGVRAAMEIELL